MGEEIKRRWDWGKLIIPGVILCFLMMPCFCFSKVVDVAFGPQWDKTMPARPVAQELKDAVGEEVSQVKAFSSFRLGGFLNSDYLWRFEAGPETVALIVTELNLKPAGVVEKAFWEQPPEDWPKAMPVGGEAYRSDGFRFPPRVAGDGRHYFLVYDKERGVVYVWFMDNF